MLSPVTALSGSSRLDGRNGAWKDDEERVAFGCDLDPALAKGFAQDLLVPFEDLRVSLAKGLDQTARAFDVRKKEGQCASWKRRA